MISKKIAESIKSSSWIRAMFEQGAKLSQQFGADRVFDFSIGNPDPEPPEAAKEALRKLVLEDRPKLHGYMSNAGYPDVRSKVAESLKKETGVMLTGDHIIMTCGAGGALNVVLKTLLNPGEEVLVFAPFFVEYLSYIDNHGGKGVVLKTRPDTFEPDPAVLEAAVNANTKAILLNYPNNPTGIVLREGLLKQIFDVLEKKGKELGACIYAISDEPYRKLVYDGAKVPSVLRLYKNSIVVDSFSKSLSLPGERIGYIAVNPEAEDVELMMNGLVNCNRSLGFVNAPSIFQKVVAEAVDATVDTDIYKKRRDLLYNGLAAIGYSCIKPQGAFYLFPKSLIPDDVEFCRHALKYNLILVPGTGFGMPGYFRLAYCVSVKTIENSLPAFKALFEEYTK